MSGIVLELQQEALSKDANIESLLRKAYVIAKKLKLKEFEDWIKQEQDGYKEEVPQYRYIGGALYALNPANGRWIPVGISDGGRNKFSSFPIKEGMSSLNDLYITAKDNVSFSISSKLTDTLNKTAPFETIYSYVVPKSQLHQVISTVQNNILNWTLLLEENGIVGENLSFTETEIKNAQAPSINNYINNFYANVEGMDLQQGNSK